MSTFLSSLVIGALALVVYTYFGYPALLWCWCRVLRAWRRNRPGPERRPVRAVSFVVVLRNAEQLVVRRIENLLNQQGLPEMREVLVYSDGSSDATIRRAVLWLRDRLDQREMTTLGPNGCRVSRFAAPGLTVQLFDSSVNRGKAAALNELLPLCNGEVVILADARQQFAATTSAELCSRMEQANLVAVSGELIFREHSKTTATAQGVDLYWRYEKALRRMEAEIDSTCGCTGAVYAVRRERFVPVDRSLVLDDMAIPMLMMRDGGRIGFEPNAPAYDDAARDYATEHRRKIRTLAGNLQLCHVYPWLLLPWRNRIWLQFVSHKLLRLLCPWLLLLIWAASAVLGFERVPWRIVAYAQGVGYALGAGVCLWTGRLPRPWAAMKTFLMLNVTALQAWMVFLRGGLNGTWGENGA